MAEAAPRWVLARSLPQRYGLMACFGALAALGQAPFSLPLMTIVGLIGAFWACPAPETRRRAFASGLCFGTAYFVVALHWIVEPFLVDLARHGWMAPFALVFLSMGLALIWGGAFVLARAGGRWTLAMAMTCAELLRAYLFGGFPWAMPAYALVDGVLAQAGAWIGPHGLNLLLFASAAALAGWRQNKVIAAAGASVFIISLIPIASDTTVENERPVVRLIQPNAPQHLKWDPDYLRVFFDRSIRLTQSGLERPDLVIWPETSVPAPLDASTNTRAAIARAARGAPVVVGLNRFEGLRIFNSAAALDETGAVTGVYDKHHLVPFGEFVPFGDLMAGFGIHGLAAKHGGGYSAGPGPRLLDLGELGKALPLICYEAVFPQDMRGTETRPDFLMQITNDAWFGSFSGPYQHLAQARMRAIEQGLPMLRAANTGISAVIDVDGRVVASLPLNTEGFLDAPLPAPRPPTLYSRTGDLPLGTVAILLAIVLTLRARRKTD